MIFHQFMPPAAKNLFEKRFLDFQKLFISIIPVVSAANLGSSNLDFLMEIVFFSGEHIHGID